LHSVVPSPDHDLHFVLCDFGKYGKAYIETDPSEADRDTIVRNMRVLPAGTSAFVQEHAYAPSQDLSRF
jgi:hypothetical protein